MAGQIVLGKGAAPATPSSGNNTLYVEGSASSFNLGILKSLDASGVLAVLSDNARINRLRNSGFWFAQRQAPGTATTYSSLLGRAITADGWGVTNENASATYQRTDTLNAAPETGLQGRYYGTFLKITSTGKIAVTQVIEGSETAALRGRVVRFQCWMKATTASNVRLGIIALGGAGTIDAIPAGYLTAFNGGGTDPSLGANLTYVTPINTVQSDTTGFSGVNGNAVDCVLTTAWQRFGHVFTVPSNCLNIVVSVWSQAQYTATNGFSIAQASLTDGYELRDWMPESYEIEWARVRRFYQSSFQNTGIAPAQNAGTGTGEVYGMAGKAGALAEFIPIRYEPRMRVAPSLTTFNPSAANAQVRDVTGAVDCSATATAANNLNAVNITATGNAATAVGNQLAVHFTADAEL